MRSSRDTIQDLKCMVALGRMYQERQSKFFMECGFFVGMQTTTEVLLGSKVQGYSNWTYVFYWVLWLLCVCLISVPSSVQDKDTIKVKLKIRTKQNVCVHGSLSLYGVSISADWKSDIRSSLDSWTHPGAHSVYSTGSTTVFIYWRPHLCVWKWYTCDNHMYIMWYVAITTMCACV